MGTKTAGTLVQKEFFFFIIMNGKIVYLCHTNNPVKIVWDKGQSTSLLERHIVQETLGELFSTMSTFVSISP